NDRSARLLEIEPDVGRFLTPEERDAAEQLLVPVRTVPKTTVDVRPLLEESGAFGAIVLDGMLLHRLQIGDQLALVLRGPGDVLLLARSPRSMLLAESSVHPAVRTELALLGTEVMIAAYRWPRIVAGLQVRVGEQLERL